MPNSRTPCLQIEAHPITARSTVREALQLMNAKRTNVLPVIDDLTGQPLGIVLRQALERGCVKMGHDADQCLIVQHTLRDVLEASGGGTPSRTNRPAARKYRLLLDAAGEPLVILQYN